ncbi:DUF2563 family protein [Mycolicibacter acidiphilus]|nr:DUF2563 family protein [Mycolicibacter acidiphilus]
MEVDTAHLQAGAGRCGDAAQTASTAAGNLAGKKPAAGIFGDFAEAHAFHQAVSAAHQGHVEQLQSHHHTLTDIGDKSLSGAQAFTARDTASADSLRAAETGFGTT